MIEPTGLKKPSPKSLYQRPPGKPCPQPGISNDSFSAYLDRIDSLTRIPEYNLLPPPEQLPKTTEKPTSEKTSPF